MAGTALAAAVVMVAGTAALGIGAVSGAAAAAQTIAGAADLAALAAADVAMGVVSGDPCAVASRIARASGVHVTECEVSESVGGVSVTVVVEGRFGIFPVQVGARAGSGPL